MQDASVIPLGNRHLDHDSPQEHMALPVPAIRMPVVAAIVCNYNQKEFLQESIASMLGQTYPHMEYVVVDDFSTDGSAEVVDDILARIGKGRVAFIRHEQNRGQMAAMLTGLDATTAPFVAWLDADDIWHPEFIERHVAHHLNPRVNAALSTSNVAVIDRHGTLIAGADPSMSTTSPFRKRVRSFRIKPVALERHGKGIDFSAVEPLGPVFINRQYESWVWSPTSGLFFRRAAVEAIRPSRCEGLRTGGDHYLARFGHVVGGTIWMNETLGYYRSHGSNHFAKRAVYGDVPIGVHPKHITEEGNYLFAAKLREGTILVNILAPQNLPKLLLQIGRSPRAIPSLLANRNLRRAVRFKDRLRLLKRYVGACLGLQPKPERKRPTTTREAAFTASDSGPR
jgi:glycosyltransferase involved in cell wall biosynthesis